MNKARLIRHFGTKAALARAAGVSRQAVGQWPDVVPLLRQYQLRERFPGLDDQLRKVKK